MTEIQPEVVKAERARLTCLVFIKRNRIVIHLHVALSIRTLLVMDAEAGGRVPFRICANKVNAASSSAASRPLVSNLLFAMPFRVLSTSGAITKDCLFTGVLQ